MLALYPFALRAESPALVKKGEYVIIPAKSARLMSHSTSRTTGSQGVQLVHRDGNSTITAYNSDDDECAKIIKENPGTLCSPNFIEYLNATPNDQFFASEQWAWHNPVTGEIDIDAPEAWDESTGSQNTIVAVIDSGIQTNHPDLSQNLWVNQQEVPNNNIDDDNNGYIDDYYGFNAILNNGNVEDDNGHGTNISGIIAARGNNSIGTAGVNWNLRLITVKAFNAEGTADTFKSLAAINYVIDLKKNKGLNIIAINYSAGGKGFSSLVSEAIQRAADAGILFITAAGNSGTNNDESPQYPAGYDVASIVSVASVDRNGSMSVNSNFGAGSVDFFAPGSSIASTGLNSTYVRLGFGTSFSTAFVSGAVALIKSKRPELDAMGIRSLLVSTLKLRSNLQGFALNPGVLNLGQLLKSQAVPTPVPTTSPTATPTPSPSPSSPVAGPGNATPTPANNNDGLNYYKISVIKTPASTVKKSGSKKPLRIQIKPKSESIFSTENGIIEIQLILKKQACTIATIQESSIGGGKNLTINPPKAGILKTKFILKKAGFEEFASNKLSAKLEGPASSSPMTFEQICLKTKVRNK